MKEDFIATAVFVLRAVVLSPYTICTAIIYSVSFGRTGSLRLDRCSCLLRDTQDCFALTEKVHFVEEK